MDKAARESLALSLLDTALAAPGASKAALATRLGISRPYVSRVMNGDMNPIPETFIARVIDRLHVVAECPATTLAQPRSECKRLALGKAPTHNPLSMRIWRICQSCPHKPEE
ncbi:MAG: helix-turn-helix transcriptional regulator [Rhodocyclaceae bacterium]|nr:helix-turn-helix transcriptional regulator [Rhodocyclaceae bacterium]